ncbi:MAG: fructokinase [Sphingomonas sp.]|nr:ROK family protein [Sphingomonas sp.]PZU09297.1 MAG: fructokinase [Sphingomonas sp.]
MPAPAAASVRNGNDVPEPLFAGVELGGTKTIAVIGQGGKILDRVTIPTTRPAETLAATAEQLRSWYREHRPAALGVASFGPIALNARHGEYGHMLSTPKEGWSGAAIVGPLVEVMPVPVALHTDVTAAALAEGRWGAARGVSDFVYVTIGTGIGMGVVAGGRPVTGRMHPEAGHLRVRRMAGDGFAGNCPFHGDCLEGLAAGPAIAARTGTSANKLSPEDPAWIPVADALAEGMVSLFLTLSCERVIVGGGVGVGQPHLLALVRDRIGEKLAGYLPDMDEATLRAMIVHAEMGADAGPLGTLELAALARG